MTPSFEYYLPSRTALRNRKQSVDYVVDKRFIIIIKKVFFAAPGDFFSVRLTFHSVDFKGRHLYLHTLFK